MNEPQYTLEGLMQAAGCEKYPLRWASIFDKAMARYDRAGTPLADPAYYDRLQEKYGCMGSYLELYKEAARQTAASEPLCRFLSLLAFALEDKENRTQDIGQLGLLKAPADRDPLAWNMITGLAVCSQLEETKENLIAKGFPAACHQSCLELVVACGIRSYMRLHGGQPGYRLLGWAQNYVACKLWMIGRLEAELFCAFKGHAKVYRGPDGALVALANNIRLHGSGFALGSKHYEDEADAWEAGLEETEEAVTGHPYLENGAVSRERVTLSKREWKKLLEEGDPVIGIHIPERPGEPLTPEAVDRTLEKIKAFASEIGYAYKGFTCGSWLMDPQLKAIVGPESNIARFSDRFRKLTVKSRGEAVFTFVFKKPGMDFDLASLPERTRLERGIKGHYLDGKNIYEVFGYFI